MKFSNVVKISAIGTRGAAEGVEFTAKQDGNGKYVLNKKTTSPANGNGTNRAENKFSVETLTEAANALATDDYLINLVCPEGKRALRRFSKVTVECA